MNRVESAYEGFCGVFSSDPLEDHVDLKNLEKKFVKFEEAANMFGYMPFVSTTTGQVRCWFGAAQFVAAFVIAIFKFVNSFFQKEAADAQRMRSEAFTVLQYAFHGLANFVRGWIETMPVVNLAGLAYDMTSMRLQYQVEKEKDESQSTSSASSTSSRVVPLNEQVQVA